MTILHSSNQRRSKAWLCVSLNCLTIQAYIWNSIKGQLNPHILNSATETNKQVSTARSVRWATEVGGPNTLNGNLFTIDVRVISAPSSVLFMTRGINDGYSLIKGESRVYACLHFILTICLCVYVSRVVRTSATKKNIKLTSSACSGCLFLDFATAETNHQFVFRISCRAVLYVSNVYKMQYCMFEQSCCCGNVVVAVRVVPLSAAQHEWQQ